jgi:hypothetical protein
LLAGRCSRVDRPMSIEAQRRLNVLKESLLERSGYGGVMM